MKLSTKILLAFTICAVFVLMSFGPEKKMIVIDAGHGGHDFGAVIDDHKEKDIVRKIARQIVSFNHSPNLEFFVITDDDKFTDLKQRVKAIDALKPDLVISLHVNADKNVAMNGPTASVSTKNPHYASAKETAKKLIGSLGSGEILDADFFLIKNVSSPAITLSVGYLSNEGDRAMLTSDKGQREVARKIFDGIIR